MCPTSNQTPDEVCRVIDSLEISPSHHSPGDLHKQGEMPTSISGKSSAEGHKGAEDAFKKAPNFKGGKTSGGSMKGR